MIFVFKFPDIGEGIHEGKILEWYASRGQTIKEGDSLVKVETDKVVADIPAPRTGLVKNLFGSVGQTINVGDVLAELEMDPAAAAASAKVEKVEEGGFGVVGQIEAAQSDAFLPATGEGMEHVSAPEIPSSQLKVLASPVARRVAQQMGVDIRAIRGTGPGGRVLKDDILQAHGAPRATPAPPAAPLPAVTTPPAAAVEYEELSQIRKTIMAKMVQSKFTAPHMTVHEEVEVSRLVQMRHEAKDAMAAHGVKLSYLPFIVRAVVLALKKHRKLNCRLDVENNRIIYQNYCHIGIAVDSPDGLVVPVLRDADRKSIAELSTSIADFAARARERRLALTEIRGGTFTITNYGAIAGTHGVPIINFPEVAILGVGRVLERPVVRGGQVVAGHILPLSLSADHRIVDGAEASRFMLELMGLLSDPVTMLLM
ncbi:MAG: dihydrolipoamide acetyltransferase family protein [Acidobacteriota bacterium]